MEQLRGKSALVIGASSGIGLATARQLVGEGAQVVGVSRGHQPASDSIRTMQGDVTEAATAARLLRELRPSLVVLSAGAMPAVAPLDEQTWETFSGPWQVDTRAAFHLTQAALAMPLERGSTVVLVSSGAALKGSPMSGGYAGAKRMQWWLGTYAQQLADQRQLGIRFVTVIPNQLVADTAIGNAGATGYARALGISPAEFMKRYDVQLTTEMVASAIVSALRGEFAPGISALSVGSRGVEALDSPVT